MRLRAGRAAMGARIGLLTTSGNDTSEAEWRPALPGGVALDVARMTHDTDETDRAAKRADVERCCAELAGAAPDVAVYGCTVGSCYRPDSAGYVEGVLEAALPVPGLTTAGAVVDALAALGASSVAVSTPYAPRKTAAIGRFLRDRGLSVPSIDDAGRRLPTAYEEGLAVDVDAADAVFVSCMNHPTFEAVERLEAELDKPVVTSNQATLWAALRAVGADAPCAGPGRLFSARPG